MTTLWIRSLGRPWMPKGRTSGRVRCLDCRPARAGRLSGGLLWLRAPISRPTSCRLIRCSGSVPDVPILIGHSSSQLSLWPPARLFMRRSELVESAGSVGTSGTDHWHFRNAAVGTSGTKARHIGNGGKSRLVDSTHATRR
jgi:hypothetical protein